MLPSSDEIIKKIKMRDLFDIDDLCEGYPVKMFFYFTKFLQEESDKAVIRYIINKSIQLLDNKRVRQNANRVILYELALKLLPLKDSVKNVIKFLAELSLFVEPIFTFLSTHEVNRVRNDFILALLDSKKVVKSDTATVLRISLLSSRELSLRFVKYSFIPYQFPIYFEEMDSYVNVPAAVPHYTEITEHGTAYTIKDLVTYMHKTNPCNPKMKEQGISRFYFGPYLKLADYVLQKMVPILTEQSSLDIDLCYEIYGPMLIDDPVRYTEILLKYVLQFFANNYSVFTILQAFGFPGVSEDIKNKAVKYVKQCKKFYRSEDYCATLSFLFGLFADKVDISFKEVQKCYKATLAWIDRAPIEKIEESKNELFHACHEKHPNYPRKKFIRKLSRRISLKPLLEQVLSEFKETKDTQLIDDVISQINAEDIIIPEEILKECYKNPFFTCTYIEKKGYVESEHEEIIERHTFRAISDFNNLYNTKDPNRLTLIARLLTIIKKVTPQTKCSILEFTSKVINYSMVSSIEETGDLSFVIAVLINKKALFETPMNKDLEESILRLGEMYKYALHKRDLFHGAQLINEALDNNLIKKDHPIPKFIGCLSRLTKGCENLGNIIVSKIPNKSFLVKKP